MPVEVLSLLTTKGYVPTYNGAWFSPPGQPSRVGSQRGGLLPRIGAAYKLDDKSAVRWLCAL